MNPKARRALATIRACVHESRYRVLRHFAERMDCRGFFWGDVLGVIDDPSGVRFDGLDRFGRPKWIIAGDTTDGLMVELVCALDRDDRGRVVVFITVYWGTP